MKTRTITYLIGLMILMQSNMNVQAFDKKAAERISNVFKIQIDNNEFFVGKTRTAFEVECSPSEDACARFITNEGRYPFESQGSETYLNSFGYQMGTSSIFWIVQYVGKSPITNFLIIKNGSLYVSESVYDEFEKPELLGDILLFSKIGVRNKHGAVIFDGNALTQSEKAKRGSPKARHALSLTKVF